MKRILLLTSALLLLVPFVAKAQNPAEGRALPGPYRFNDHVDISRGDFYYNGQELTDWETRQVIGNEIFDQTYAPALRQRKTGMILSTIGGVIAGIGGIVAIAGISNMEGELVHTWYQDSNGRTWGDEYSYHDNLDTAGAAFLAGTAIFAGGSAMLSAGIPLLIIGQKRLNWVEEDTNQKISQRASLNLSSGHNGFGLCLAF